MLVPDSWTVTHARGADILNLGTDPAGEFFADGQPRPQIALPCEPDADMIADAVAAAKNADYVVAVVGDRIELIGEGRSTATLELVGGQVALLDALAATDTPMIVVVVASKPLVLPASAHTASAIIWAANPGMLGGQATAELILGHIEPSGRLPISFARHVGQQPTFYNQIDAQHGTRYADLTQEPAWVFGEGMSYTTVEYSELRIADASLGLGDEVRASVTVTNTGDRPTLETVQVYVRDVNTSATWADRELKSHTHVSLEPGQSTTVEVAVPVSHCSMVNAHAERVVEAGDFDLLVGPSSRLDALLCARFTINTAH